MQGKYWARALSLARNGVFKHRLLRACGGSVELREAFPADDGARSISRRHKGPRREWGNSPRAGGGHRTEASPPARLTPQPRAPRRPPARAPAPRLPQDPARLRSPAAPAALSGAAADRCRRLRAPRVRGHTVRLGTARVFAGRRPTEPPFSAPPRPRLLLSTVLTATAQHASRAPPRPRPPLAPPQGVPAYVGPGSR